MDRKKIIQRDLNPHKPAAIAMTLWGDRYSKMPHVGSMGFWDTLDISEKNICFELLERIDKAPNFKP